MFDVLSAYIDISRCTGFSMNRCIVRLLAFALIFISGTAFAIEIPTLYTANVTLDDGEKNPRDAAYEKGLREIVVRITGSQAARGASFYEDLFPDPARYVLQYGQGVNKTLSISFDGAAIEAVLRNAGESVWGPNRPLTLIWLAVDWGQGQREIIGADDPERGAGASRSIDRNRMLRQRLRETAARRGVPIAFPLLDSEDLQNVSFADIWGGFDEQLLQASRRYQANSVLVGRVRARAVQRNRWTYHFGGIQEEWNGQPENAMHLLADSLAAEFAYSGNAPVESVALHIAGIDSVRAYGTVQRYLEQLSQIEDLAVRTVSGDEIHYEVRLRGGRARLRRTLETSNILMPIENYDEPLPVEPFPAMDTLDFMFRAPARHY